MLGKLGIIGYSGHAYVVIEAALQAQWEIFGYCEKEKPPHNPYSLKYLGSENQLEAQIKENCKFIIGIGDNQIRKRIVDSLVPTINLASVIHPSALISRTVTLGEGTFINAQVAINAFAKVGAHCILNTGSIIEHECIIGDYVHIAPAAVLAGNVRVGNGSFIGANSTIKQGVKIGEQVIIGAGSVVIRDVPSGVTVAGNPSKIIK